MGYLGSGRGLGVQDLKISGFGVGWGWGLVEESAVSFVGSMVTEETIRQSGPFRTRRVE